MNVHAWRPQRGRLALAACLLLAAAPASAQNVRYEWQGNAYVVAEEQAVAERLVDGVIGAAPGPGAQVVFFRPPGADSAACRVDTGAGASADLPASAYYALQVAPGDHRYAVNGSPVSLQLASGERRYVRVCAQGDGAAVPTNALTFLRLVTGRRAPLYLN